MQLYYSRSTRIFDFVSVKLVVFVVFVVSVIVVVVIVIVVIVIVVFFLMSLILLRLVFSNYKVSHAKGNRFDLPQFSLFSVHPAGHTSDNFTL